MQSARGVVIVSHSLPFLVLPAPWPLEEDLACPSPSCEPSVLQLNPPSVPLPFEGNAAHSHCAVPYWEKEMLWSDLSSGPAESCTYGTLLLRNVTMFSNFPLTSQTKSWHGRQGSSTKMFCPLLQFDLSHSFFNKWSHFFVKSHTFLLSGLLVWLPACHFLEYTWDVAKFKSMRSSGASCLQCIQ